MGWVDNLASWATYYGIILGTHIHARKLFVRSCYYGLVPNGDHEPEIDYYDTKGCIYGVYESRPFHGGSLYTSLRR